MLPMGTKRLKLLFSVTLTVDLWNMGGSPSKVSKLEYLNAAGHPMGNQRRPPGQGTIPATQQAVSWMEPAESSESPVTIKTPTAVDGIKIHRGFWASFIFFGETSTEGTGKRQIAKGPLSLESPAAAAACTSRGRLRKKES